MKLKRLELSAFRQHRSLSVEFSQGITAILGPNGSGKTTLIEALCFALYGVRAVRGKVDEIPTSGMGKNDTKVTLVFFVADEAFRIERGVTKAVLYREGDSTVLAEGTRETSAAVERLLGMSFEQFEATFFVEQKGLQFLKNIRGGAERERFVTRLLGLHLFEEAQEIIRENKRDLRTSLAQADYLAQEFSRWNTDLLEIKEQVSVLKNQYSDVSQKVASQQKELEREQKLYDRIKSKYEESEKVRKELDTTSVKYEEKLRTLRAKKAQEESLAFKEKEEKEKEIVSPELIDKELQFIQQEIERERQLLTEGTVEWERTKARLAEEVNVLRRDLQKAQKQGKQLEELGPKSSCPTCGQTLGKNFKVHVEEELKKRSELEEKLLIIEKEFASWEDNKPSSEKGVARIHNLQQKERALHEQLRYGEVQALERKELRRIRDDISQDTVELQKLEFLVKERTDFLTQMDFSEGDFLQAKGRFEAQQGVLSAARLELVRHEGILRTKEGLLKKAEEEVRRLSEAQSMLDTKRGELLLLEESDEVLTEYRKEVNQQTRPRLALLAGEYLQDLTLGRYSTLEINEDYSPRVIDEGEERNVLSGGEEDIVHLSLRLALSHLVIERSGQEFNLLILDEVFGSLDAERRENVVVLLERLLGRFEQVILITHVDELKQRCHSHIALGEQEAELRQEEEFDLW